jgi:hypothetical protein
MSGINGSIVNNSRHTNGTSGKKVSHLRAKRSPRACKKIRQSVGKEYSFIHFYEVNLRSRFAILLLYPTPTSHEQSTKEYESDAHVFVVLTELSCSL